MSTETKVLCDTCGKRIPDGEPRVAVMIVTNEGPPETRDFHLDCAPEGVKP